MQTYLVGGAVRDKLLGLAVKDRDWVVVGATPDDMRAKGFKQVGADFPVFLHPKTGEEYALARTERKQGRGYHGFTVYSAPDVTLEEDLKRRDLTINAMAETEDGRLVDPFHGYADLDQKRLRHVSEAFAEDPLRILRTARFAARLQPMGFTVCQQTMSLMRTMVSLGELADLVPERVWQEVQRSLHERAPGVFFDVLRELGALDILIPELAREQTFRAGLQALHCMHRMNGTTAQRFASLLSAVPEPTAVHRTKAMKSPNDCRDMTHLVCLFMHRLAIHETRTVTPEDIMELLDKADLWRRPERFEQLLDTLACTTGAELAELIGQLRLAAQSAQDVSPQDLLKQGFHGKELGEAIRNERLARITQVLTP
ncbi:multifunctional CCA tRNA nucleotidyl transferase/2'3'-cyclic phosphodiesterase/2'nucleotidase/phosphatase [Marinobacter halophilus]|uniref:multifunctional CCA tRNA nucleotidyl transferase/2'3'-cyclic phosphodiesterase/2'nucleotidase/phosphatase n=1 Tax=Marinobacter halophilus TaxID=1323740 RepID=UPI0016659C77|nr:multifunctional CCA tRNA nucleotidyl transferase/2'3'-cyclic phosphodiesterase/2'nucleotidase/phosphatase [Marinobacter halophilus]GGC61259.1 multifunctional CCA protein [Marinobacter halophilus]